MCGCECGWLHLWMWAATLVSVDSLAWGVCGLRAGLLTRKDKIKAPLYAQSRSAYLKAWALGSL